MRLSYQLVQKQKNPGRASGAHFLNREEHIIQFIALAPSCPNPDPAMYPASSEL